MLNLSAERLLRNDRPVENMEGVLLVPGWLPGTSLQMGAVTKMLELESQVSVSRPVGADKPNLSSLQAQCLLTSEPSL